MLYFMNFKRLQKLPGAWAVVVPITRRTLMKNWREGGKYTVSPRGVLAGLETQMQPFPGLHPCP